MSSTGNQEPLGDDGLQFDHAEYAGSAHGMATCSFCHNPIHSSYYELFQKILCETCARAVQSGIIGGSKTARFLKASCFGFVAAIGGSIIIYLFGAITGLQAGIISILAGYMVGSAVRQGSGFRGGTAYQFLAVFLTYSAVAWSTVPEVYKVVAEKMHEAREEEPEKAGALKKVATEANPAAKEAKKDHAKTPPSGKGASPEKGNLASAKEEPIKAEKPATKTEKSVAPNTPITVAKEAEATVQEKVPAQEAKKAAIVPAEEKAKPNLPLAILALAVICLFMLAVCYIAPILAAFASMPGGIISLAIIFFGMQQAWQLTRRIPLDVRGPFQVGGSRAV